MFSKVRNGKGLALIFLLALATVIVAACGAPTGDGDDGQQKDDAIEDNGAANEDSHGVTWQRPNEKDLTEEVQAWLDANLENTGVYQEIFDGQTFILIAWGEKPTLGYEVNLQEVEKTEAGELRLTVQLTEPDETSMTGEAITYPYDLVTVPSGEYYNLAPVFEGAIFLQNQAFKIEEPAMFAVIGDTLHVKGEARVFEGALQVYLEDGHDILVRTHLTASAGGPEWGTFEASLPLQRKPTSPNGIIKFYEDSAKDGTPLHEITYAVQFADWNSEGP